MEDIRHDSAVQYWSSVHERRFSEINGTLSSENATWRDDTDGQFLNDTVSDAPVSQIPPKEWYIIIYSIFIAASIILTPLSRNVCYVIFMKASKTLHNKMFNSILQAPMKFFDTNPSGE